MKKGPRGMRGVKKRVTDPCERLGLVREASQLNDFEAVLLFMEAFDMNFVELYFDHSILVHIAAFGHPDVVVRVLDLDPQPQDLSDAQGSNSVAGIVMGGDRASLLRVLLQKNFSFVSSSGRCALELANLFSREECCRILLEAGAPTTNIGLLGPFWLRNYFVAAGWCLEDDTQEFMEDNPLPSLKCICRLKIRHCCDIKQRNLFAQVELLPLPKPLKQFVIWGY